MTEIKATEGLLGYYVPFLLGIPSVRARVIGESKTGQQYILQQNYDTQDVKGDWIHVEKIYYRDQYFIDDYWADTVELLSNGDAD